MSANNEMSSPQTKRYMLPSPRAGLNNPEELLSPTSRKFLQNDRTHGLLPVASQQFEGLTPGVPRTKKLLTSGYQNREKLL